MLDRLPGSICQVVMYDWLTLAAVGRLDSAFCVRGFRAELRQLQKGLYQQFYAPTLMVLRCLKWGSRRGMQFREVRLELSRFNQTSRIAELYALGDAMEALSVIHGVEALDTTRTIEEYELVKVESITRRFPFCCCICCCCSFCYVPIGEPKPSGTYHPYIEETLREDSYHQRFPATVFPHLHTMSIVLNGVMTFDWLPLAPNLQMLTIESDSLDDGVLCMAALLYRKVKHLRLFVPYQISPASFQDAMANFCNLISATSTCPTTNRFPLSVEPLLVHCPQLRYLALAGYAASDSAMVQIAARGQQLEGLDIGDNHFVTRRSLSVVAHVFRALKYFGLSLRTTFDPHPMEGVILAQVLRGNAHTLQEVSLSPSDWNQKHALLQLPAGVAAALAECAELRCLHLGTRGTEDNVGYLPILQHCAKLRTLRLPLRTGKTTISPLHPAHIGELPELQELYPEVSMEYVQDQDRTWPVWAAEVTIV